MIEVIIDNKPCKKDRIQLYFGYYATEHLLDGLVDPRYSDTYGQFIKYAEGNIYGFMKRTIDKIQECSLDQAEKLWFENFAGFKTDLDYYKSPQFLKDARTGSKIEQETFRNKLMVGIAKKIDKVTESKRGTEYLEFEMSNVMININGCMVPISIIKEDDFTIRDYS